MHLELPMNEAQLIELIKQTFLESSKASADELEEEPSSIEALNQERYKLNRYVKATKSIIEIRDALESYRIEDSNRYRQFMYELTGCMNAKLVAFFKDIPKERRRDLSYGNYDLLNLYRLATILNFLGILNSQAINDIEKLSGATSVSLLGDILMDERKQLLDDKQLISLVSQTENQELVGYILLTQLYLGDFKLANLLTILNKQLFEIRISAKNFTVPLERCIYLFQAAVLGYGNREQIRDFLSKPGVIPSTFREFKEEIIDTRKALVQGLNANRNVFSLIDSIERINNYCGYSCLKDFFDVKINIDSKKIDCFNYGLVQLKTALYLSANKECRDKIVKFSIAKVQEESDLTNLTSTKSIYTKTAVFICFYAYLRDHQGAESANQQLAEFINQCIDENSKSCAQDLLELARYPASYCDLIPNNESISLLEANFAFSTGLVKKKVSVSQNASNPTPTNVSQSSDALLYMLTYKDYVNKTKYSIAAEDKEIVDSLYLVIMSNQVGLVHKELALDILIDAQNLNISDVKLSGFASLISTIVEDRVALQLKELREMKETQQRMLSYLETLVKPRAELAINQHGDADKVSCQPSPLASNSLFAPGLPASAAGVATPAELPSSLKGNDGK